MIGQSNDSAVREQAILVPLQVNGKKRTSPAIALFRQGDGDRSQMSEWQVHRALFDYDAKLYALFAE